MFWHAGSSGLGTFQDGFNHDWIKPPSILVQGLVLHQGPKHREQPSEQRRVRPAAGHVIVPHFALTQAGQGVGRAFGDLT